MIVRERLSEADFQRILRVLRNFGLVLTGLIIILVLGVLLGVGIAYATDVPLP